MATYGAVNGQCHHVDTAVNSCARVQKAQHLMFVTSLLRSWSIVHSCTCQIYGDIWEVPVGQMLLCQQETGSPHDAYTVLLTKGSNLVPRPYYVL